MERLTLWPQLPSFSALAPLVLSALALLFVLKPYKTASADDHATAASDPDHSNKAAPASSSSSSNATKHRPSNASASAVAAATPAITAATPRTFSAWVLLEGFLVAQLLTARSKFLRVFRKPAAAYASGGEWDEDVVSPVVFGLTRRHAVVHSGSDPSFADAVLKRPGRVLHNDPAQWDLSVKVFQVNPKIRPQFDRIVAGMFTAVTRSLVQETHARPTCAALYSRLTERAPRLASADGTAWTRHAGLWEAPGGAVEADLYVLVRDFTTHLSLDVLCGRGLVADAPGIVKDLFTFDSGFAALLVGVPTWAPIPAVRRAVEARSRVLGAIGRWHEWLDAALAGTVGKDAVPGVSQMFWDRQGLYRSESLSMADRAPLDLSLLWAMNANTSPFVFWVLAFVYADPGLVKVLRDEIGEHLRLSEAGIDGIDSDGILHRCPRLKAAYLETFRIAHVPTSVRFVAREFAVPAPLAAFEPVACRSPGYFSEAPLSGSPTGASSPSAASSPPATPVSPGSPTVGPTASGPRSPALSLSSAPGVVFRAGTYLTVPHSVSQNDPRLFPEPEKFVADRFLVETPAGLKAAYGCLRPWGEGHPMCKGRVFAEREVLMVVAVILSLWDVDLLDGVPDRVTAAGVMQPKGPCRARLRRRALSVEG